MKGSRKINIVNKRQQTIGWADMEAHDHINTTSAFYTSAIREMWGSSSAQSSSDSEGKMELARANGPAARNPRIDKSYTRGSTRHPRSEANAAKLVRTKKLHRFREHENRTVRDMSNNSSRRLKPSLIRRHAFRVGNFSR